MKHSFLITVALFVSMTALADEQPKEIPLDQIWAWRMPGTKNVGTLDVVETGGVKRYRRLGDIFGGIGFLPKGEKAAPAFVVEGEGETALENARAVFKKEKKRAEVVPANTELSLVFYSHSCARWVHLVAVEKSERLITVKYRFVNHFQAINRIHFAFIPIGKFTPGVVEVKMEQQKSTRLDIPGRPPGTERPPILEMERLVSGSFSFKVHK